MATKVLVAFFLMVTVLSQCPPSGSTVQISVLDSAFSACINPIQQVQSCSEYSTSTIITSDFEDASGYSVDCVECATDQQRKLIRISDGTEKCVLLSQSSDFLIELEFFSTNEVRTGATCNDDTTSTSTGSGTCSGHGGVRQWHTIDIGPFQCKTYMESQNPEYLCIECFSDSTHSLLVPFLKEDGRTINMCIEPQRDQEDRCEVYTYAYLAKKAIPYCIECSQQFPNLTPVQQDSAGICTQFPEIENCRFYQLNDFPQPPECKKCEGTLQEPFCTPSDGCDGDYEAQITDNDPICVSSGLIPFCQVYNPDASPLIESCDDCAEDFTLFETQSGNNICVSEIQNCIEYNSSNIFECLGCADDIYLVENSCIEVIETPDQISGCNQVRFEDGATKCVSCQQGFSLDYEINKCLRWTEFCANRTQTGICIDCIPGYTLITQSVQICVKEPQNCLIVNSQTGLCQECIDEIFQVRNGVCETVTICSEENFYVDRDGNCVEGQTENCGIYSLEGVCQECQEGFKFNLEFECVQNESEVVCPESTSTERFEVGLNGCVAVDINCAEDGFTDSGCFKCIEGYYLYQKACFLIN